MIKNLCVKNFKSIKNINIDLKMLNILSGINSSGKSTLCQILLLIQKYAKVISTNGNRENFSINYADFSLGKVKDVLYMTFG